jgi:hypothetical protein
VREEDAGGREEGAPLDLKMPLENGRADERVSRGQASERAVCVCEAVSVEMWAHRPPLPTAVVCPPGRRRRRRLAITAVMRCPLSRISDSDPSSIDSTSKGILSKCTFPVTTFCTIGQALHAIFPSLSLDVK